MSAETSSSPQAEASCYLFMTEGSSDKEYHAHLRKAPGSDTLWVVDYANGKRGAVGQSKNKVAPTTYEAALKEYEKLVKTKKKDGYTESESGVRFTNSDGDREHSGHSPQLSVAIDRDQAAALLNDPDWGLQQKANGERRGIVINGLSVRGTNKLGQFVNIPETWVMQMRAIAGNGNTQIEGEQIGTMYYAFDLIEHDGQDLRSLPFWQRFGRLQEITKGLIGPGSAIECMQLLDLVQCGSALSKSFLSNLEDARQEGAVFKRLSAPYSSGRDTNSLKFKFKESMTCIVTGKNATRSVSIGAMQYPLANVVALGNVKIPANHPIPEPGELVEVQYLYYNPGGGLEQPVYLGKRNDIERHDASLSQITRFKPTEDVLTLDAGDSTAPAM